MTGRSRRCYSAGRRCVSACRRRCCSSSTASRCWRTRVPSGWRRCGAWSTWCWSRPECWEGRAANAHRADELPTGGPQTRDKLSFLHRDSHNVNYKNMKPIHNCTAIGHGRIPISSALSQTPVYMDMQLVQCTVCLFTPQHGPAAAFADTHWVYLRRDGQGELTWVNGHPSRY